MEDQQNLEQIISQINAYSQQAELIQQQIELIQTSIAEVDTLTNTLDDLKGKDSVEAFVPVGAGSFMKGDLKNTDEIIISIGAGYAIKKDVEGAKEIVKGQRSDLEDSLDKMLQTLQQTTDMVGFLKNQANQIAAASQGQMTGY